MNNQQKRLHDQIWKTSNEVRGAVNGYDFRQCFLRILFYRCISDKKSCKIAPEKLFKNFVEYELNGDVVSKLKEVFESIEHASGEKFNGLFEVFEMCSNSLGTTQEEKNKRLIAIIKGVASVEIPDNDDAFGDAYEFMISKYAANAGKSGGEFFTPQQVSKLLYELIVSSGEKEKINKVYDPTCGSGSLLLQFKERYNLIDEGFFGQEVNPTSYDLCRMNMIMHDITTYDIHLGDTLTNPAFKDDKFDVIVSNPPYSLKWDGAETFLEDERFAPAGVLAPKSKADLAFVMHVSHYLSDTGQAAIVCFPGALYRSGREEKIRKYLVDSNYVEGVIALPPNLFYGTTIATTILMLSKNKKTDIIRFVKADGEDFFEKNTNKNVLTDSHIEQIVCLFRTKNNRKYMSKSVTNKQVAENNYDLSVHTYVQSDTQKEDINIHELNAKVKQARLNYNKNCDAWDKLIEEMETGV